MKWELKHFGLELYTHQELESRTRVNIFEPATFEEKNGRSEVVKFGLLDNRLQGPKNIETFTKCIGRISLAVPIIRTECKDDILAILSEWAAESGCLEGGIKPEDAIQCEANGWPFKMMKVDLETNEKRYEKMDNEEIWNILKEFEPREIKGNEFIKHNRIALPETMIIQNLPVPSILARPSKIDSEGNYVENDLTLKLFDILRINTRLRENIHSDAPEIIIEDLSELLQYHITTYLDNRTLGIPPSRGIGGKPLVTIAQRLGKNMSEHIQLETKVDSSIKRIVRCINSGERVIQVTGGSLDELAVELTKQCALKKVFSNLIWDDPVTCHQINSAGECKKMMIDILENDEFVRWDNYSKIEKSTIIHAYKDSKITEFEVPSILPTVLQKDRRYSYDEKEKVIFEICKIVYSIIEKQTIERNYPSIIIIPQEILNDTQGLEKAYHILESNELNRLEVVLILWSSQEFTNWRSSASHQMAERGSFKYNPTNNSKRYTLIAINQIKKMKEFENYLEEIIRWEKSKEYENDLKIISKIIKCLIYPEIKRLIGQVLHAEGSLNKDILKEYTISVIETKIQLADIGEWLDEMKTHLKYLTEQTYENIVPISEIHEKRKVTIEKKEKEVKFEKMMNERSKKQAEENEPVKSKTNLTYEDLKGLEPLITWCKRKGRLFSDEAKEFGFEGYPKGLLLTGVPGCGKTMTAKVISNEWGMDFKRYQADAFVSQNVGGAEEKTRRILDELGRCAPVICFVDEAEKIFGQTKATEMYRTPDASRDAVESMILQFIEENEKGVFFIFTANDYEKLSPALVDRFDERFFLDLPTKESRKEIIKLTLKNNKQDFSKYNLDKLADTSNGFTGRDIRSAVNEGMMIAFDNNRKLNDKDLISAFQVISPTSKIHKENIEKMRKLVSEGKMRKANTYEPGEVINTDDDSFRGFE